jgi:hypothetical protein
MQQATSDNSHVFDSSIFTMAAFAPQGLHVTA